MSAPTKMQDWLEHLAEAYKPLAKAVSQHRLLDHQRQVVLAVQARSAIEDGTATSHAQAETVARSSPEYMQHIAKLAEAEGNLAAVRARIDYCKLQFECARSVAANTRAELSALPGIK
jgi:anti-sigma-K factor RskA